jgi:hypothetical protein
LLLQGPLAPSVLPPAARAAARERVRCAADGAPTPLWCTLLLVLSLPCAKRLSDIREFSCTLRLLKLLSALIELVWRSLRSDLSDSKSMDLLQHAELILGIECDTMRAERLQTNEGDRKRVTAAVTAAGGFEGGRGV